jgi:MTH538 TIR-like domain (DUF1863)
MAGLIYVAFDGDSDKWAYAFKKGWKANKNVDFDFEDAHDLDAMTNRAQNEAYVKSTLKERMKASDALVVIVGEKTKNLFKFVRWEMELALERGLPIVVANLNGINGRDVDLCPAVIRDACAVHVPFKLIAVNHALETWPSEFAMLGGSGSSIASDRLSSGSASG